MDFPERLAFNNPSQDINDADFVAIKLGDMNYSANLQGDLQVRGSKPIQAIGVEDKQLEAGKEYKFDVNINNSNLTAIQFALRLDKNKVTSFRIMKGNLPQFDNGNFEINEKDGVVGTAWAKTNGEKLSDQNSVIQLIITPRQTAWLHELVSLDEQLTENLAYDTVQGNPFGEGVEKQLQLKFTGLTTDNLQFELHQNHPNPFMIETKISFILTETNTDTLSIYDVTGREVYTINKAFNKGYNEVYIDKSVLKNSGIYFYRLQSDKFTALKQMQFFVD